MPCNAHSKTVYNGFAEGLKPIIADRLFLPNLELSL
jgi:hypothetical protein